MTLYKKISKRPRILQSITGISCAEFAVLVQKLKKPWKKITKKKHQQTGRPLSLNLENHLFCTLIYYRTYITQLFLGAGFGVDAATICRSIKRIEPLLAKVTKLKKVKKRVISKELNTIIVDVTEQQIQRPQDDQQNFYSGKKKMHTYKTEVQVTEKGKIIKVSPPEPGSTHDLALRRKLEPLPPDCHVLADSGYQGLQKDHPNISLPKRKRRNQRHTEEEKRHNRALSQKRIIVENVIGRLKVFGILHQVFRNPLDTYTIKMGIIAGLTNMKKGF